MFNVVITVALRQILWKIATLATIFAAILNWSCPKNFSIENPFKEGLSLGRRIRIVFQPISTLLSWTLFGGMVLASIVFSEATGWQINIFSVLLFFILAAIGCVVGMLVNGTIKWCNNMREDAGIDSLIVLLSIVIYIASALWYGNALLRYNANIETTTEILEQMEEYELAIFREVPIQHVTGEISGVYHRIEGELQTYDMIPYAYFLKNGNLKYDSAATKDSEIILIKEGGGSAKIEIKTTTTKTLEVNHNEGTTEEKNSNRVVKYYFYVPESVVYTIGDMS